MRSQEICDVLEAAITLVSLPTGARNVAALSMPICPSSDGIEIDDFASNKEDD
jgi:hypothetical protein